MTDTNEISEQEAKDAAQLIHSLKEAILATQAELSNIDEPAVFFELYAALSEDEHDYIALTSTYPTIETIKSEQIQLINKELITALIDRSFEHELKKNKMLSDKQTKLEAIEAFKTVFFQNTDYLSSEQIVEVMNLAQTLEGLSE